MSNPRLFLLAVLIWGTTWHAIVLQLAHATPEFGVALRFSLAGLLVLGYCAWRGLPWRVAPRVHAWLAFQGVFMYSVSYLCVYHAEKHVPSGLVAVGYSASPLINGLASHFIWRTPLTRRFLTGGLLGLAGVVLIFWPQFGAVGRSEGAALGAGLTVAAVLLAAVGSLASSRNKVEGLPFWPALGWGMVYGSLCSWSFVLASGQALTLPTSPAWWASLAYLVLAGSVLAFACYLLLQQRLGPGPASMTGVATPVLALAVSTALEGYRPDALAAVGVALAVVGNVLALGLWPRRPAAGA